MRVLVLGASGMLGHAVFRGFGGDTAIEAWGTLRSPEGLQHFTDNERPRLVTEVDVLDDATLTGVIDKVEPGCIVNCVGLVKQLSNAEDPLAALPINAMLPHRVARMCGPRGIRLIHMSTDCVFSGRTGGYLESDVSDAEDLYGKSKFIGELHDYPHAITLRTSIIGRELESARGLVEWFLAQQGRALGYRKSVFSGLPTVELARVMKDFVAPRPELSGLYHVSAEPIAKYDLLRLIAEAAGKKIEIQPVDEPVIDRSLNSDRFRRETGYEPPEWPALAKMVV